MRAGSRHLALAVVQEPKLETFDLWCCQGRISVPQYAVGQHSDTGCRSIRMPARLTRAAGRQEGQLLQELREALMGLQGVPVCHQEAEGSFSGGFCQATPER